MFRPTVLLLSALAFAFGGLGKIEAGIIAVDLGTAAPPATLGPIPYKMTPFPNDARPNFTNVTSVPGLFVDWDWPDRHN